MPHNWIKTASDWLLEPFVLFILGAIAFCVGYISYYDFRIVSLFGLFDLVMVDVAGLFNAMMFLYMILFFLAARNQNKTIYQNIHSFEKFFRKMHHESAYFSIALIVSLFLLISVVLCADFDSPLYMLLSYAAIVSALSVPLVYLSRIVSFFGGVGRKVTITMYIRCALVPIFAGWFSAIGATRAAWNDVSRRDRVIITMSSGSLFGRMPMYTQKGIVILVGETAKDYSFIPFDSIQRIDRYPSAIR